MMKANRDDADSNVNALRSAVLEVVQIPCLGSPQSLRAQPAP